MPKRIACGWIAVLLLILLAVPAYASEPYRGYRYDNTGTALSAVNGYTPDAIVTGAMLDIGAFTNPEDLFADPIDRYLYILDSGHKRVVVLNENLQLVEVFSTYFDKGEEKPITGLSSVFVSKDAIYLADRDNARILKLEKGTRELLLEYTCPQSTTYTSVNFMPYRIVVDSADNLYALCKGVFQGAVVFNKEGEFAGYYGSTFVVPTFRVVLSNMWKRIMTSEQKSVMERFVPVEYVGIAIDQKDFVYTVTQYSDILSRESLRKLNPKGVNILYTEKPFGDLETYVYRGKTVQTQFTDVCADEEGFFYGLDITFGRVFQYDSQANFVFSFGGSGTQQGTFRQPCAIDVLGDKVFVLDRMKGSVTVFKPTEFGEKVRNALILYNDGRYDEAREPWREVIRLDPSYKVAYQGLGNAELNLHNYQEAMRYFKIAEDSEGYSIAFKQYRLGYIREHFSLIIGGVVLLCVVVYAYNRFMEKRNANRDITFVHSNTYYLKALPWHPINAYEEFNAQKAGSWLMVLGILAMWLVSEVMKQCFLGFAVTGDSYHPEEMNILYVFCSTFVLFGLFCGSNWAFSTLTDGSGTFRNICMTVAYALVPMIVLNIAAVLLSRVMVAQERVFYDMMIAIGMMWTGMLIVCGLRTIHDFSFGKTFALLGLTVFGIVFILFLLVLSFSLYKQLVDFFGVIFNELMFRVS